MARTPFPRAEYVHTREWLRAVVEARLRLPWLPVGVRMARTALVVGCIVAAAVAAVAATLISVVAGVAFWSGFAVVFGIVLGWLAWTGMRAWRRVRHWRRGIEDNVPGWRPQ